MPENSTHKCTNAVNNVQTIRNSSHMAKILSVYNRLQAGDYENGNGGKRRVSRLTQFIHATLHMFLTTLVNHYQFTKIQSKLESNTPYHPYGIGCLFFCSRATRSITALLKLRWTWVCQYQNVSRILLELRKMQVVVTTGAV